jgi:MtaA/CmuA family methyltransferase
MCAPPIDESVGYSLESAGPKEIKMNGRERVFALLDGRPVDHLPCMPLTMMFASDLIGAKYLDYATDYRVHVEGQIRVAEDFNFDYVSFGTDPASEAADCGAAVMYFPDQPPAIDESKALLADKRKLAALRVPDPHAPGSRMKNGLEVVALLKERVGEEKLVEAWVEGPIAEAADLRGINAIMLDVYDDPGFVRDLFAFVVEMELGWAKAEIEAGAIGDAAASLVNPRTYAELVWPFEKKMVDAIHAMGARVRLHICGNTRLILEGMGRLGCDIVDLDSLSPVGLAREKMGPKQVLMGNIDPVRTLRDGTPETICQELAECHSQARDRFVIGAGCEVPRDTPHENVRALSEYARSHHPDSWRKPV